MNQLPIFLNLKDRRILLLGNGEMADAKRRLYERAGAVITDDEHASGIALAKALRQRLEQLLPAGLGALSVALYQARERIQQIWPEGAARRKAIDAALDPNGPLDVLADHKMEDMEA